MNGENQTVLHLLKQLSSSVLLQFLRLGRQFQQGNFLKKQGGFLLRRKSNSIQQDFKVTSLIAEDSQRRTRDFGPYGKNQISIRCQKTGTVHISKNNLPKIHGVQITGISPVEAELCPERFLKVCPMYFIPVAPTAKKVGMEKKMMFFRGNSIRSFAVMVLLCTVFGECLNGLSKMLRSQTALIEKKYERFCEDEKKMNQEAFGENL